LIPWEEGIRRDPDLIDDEAIALGSCDPDPDPRQSFRHKIGERLPSALALWILASKSGSPYQRTSQNAWRAPTN
jgi:hypothetical protein